MFKLRFGQTEGEILGEPFNIPSTAWFSAPVCTPYRAARSASTITFCPRMTWIMGFDRSLCRGGLFSNIRLFNVNQPARHTEFLSVFFRSPLGMLVLMYYA